MRDSGRKRILISILGFLPGGAEIMAIRLANALQARGCAVGVHCMHKPASAGVRSRLRPEIPVYTTDRFWQLALVLLWRRYSVVNTHGVPCQMLVARMKRRLPFLRFWHVAVSHGGYEGMPPAEALTTVKDVDRAVNVWAYVADNNLPLLRAAGISEKKLRKIGNGMEPPTEIRPAVLADYGIPKDACVFTVITRAVPKKCWRECMEAVRMARELTGRDIHLLLGGCGEVFEELRREPPEAFVHLPGEIRRPCDLYAASYCGLLLSVLECAPLGIIEMYYAGIPVIATDTGDVAEMLRVDGEPTGLLVPLTETGRVSVSASARAIAEMVQNRAFYQLCRENAARKAAAFGIDAVAARYLTLFTPEKEDY